MLRIEYCAKGLAITAFTLETWFDAVRAGGSFRVSTELPITRVQVAIAEGDIPHEDVEFLFRGQVLNLNRDGFTDRWPEGFCDACDKLARRLLEAHVNRSVSNDRSA